jgi:NAD(P)-dependent dehydrogenase (short-subunit alcohol dehydrogenase family)
MKKLQGKVAVITGATSGIGAGIARVFAREGAQLVIGGRRESLAKELASELGKSVIPLRMDVCNEADIADAVDVARREFGRLDCMVSNAGSAGVMGSIAEAPSEEVDRTIAVLFRSVVLTTKHAARAMKDQNSGTIINVASVGAFLTGYSPHIYSACKAAVVQLTRSTATELGELGIRVNCICPGLIPTQIFGTAFGLGTEQAEALTHKLKEAFRESQPLKRAGESLDIGLAALWLASEDSSFVNGHSLVVDGGLSLGQSWSGAQEHFGRLISLIPQTPTS